MTSWIRVRIWTGLFLLFGMIAGAAAQTCAVCDGRLGWTTYRATDQVEGEKKLICYACAQLPNACFACGLPVKADSVPIQDGRYFCSRDGKNAILDEKQAIQACERVKGELDRLFSRFMEFPDNVTLGLMDRVDLLAWKVPGNDFECPNILGCFRGRTNENGVLSGDIRILSGLSAAQLEATCAHEYSHAWVHANLSPARKNHLARDAEEGFCELVSYLLMDAMQNPRGKAAILQNAYTRGQVHRFVEAEQKFGFNEILDWMRHGNGPLLLADLNSARDVTFPRATVSGTAVVAVEAPIPSAPATADAVPEVLTLKGISWAGDKSWAWINNGAFTRGESGKVRLGRTNVMIRCVEIRPDRVRIKVLPSEQELELALSSPAEPGRRQP